MTFFVTYCDNDCQCLKDGMRHIDFILIVTSSYMLAHRMHLCIIMETLNELIAVGIAIIMVAATIGL